MNLIQILQYIFLKPTDLIKIFLNMIMKEDLKNQKEKKKDLKISKMFCLKEKKRDGKKWIMII